MSDQSPEEGFNDQYLGHNQEQEGISYSQSQNYHKGQKRMQNNYQQYGDEEFEDGEIVDDQQNEGSVVSKKSTPSKQMVFSNGQPIIENPEKDQNDMMHQDDMEDHNNEGQNVNSQAMYHATHQNDKLIDRTTPLQNVSATLPYPDESSQLNQEGQLPVTTQFDCGNGGYPQENNDDDEHMDVEMAPQFHHEEVQENENEQMNQVEEINSASFHTAKDYENSQNPEEQEVMIQDDQEQKEEIVESVEDQFQQLEEEGFAREVPESVQTVEEEEQFEQPIAQPSSRAVSPKKSTKSGKKSVNKSQRSTRSRRGKKDQVISETIEEEEISDKIEPEELQAALSKKKKRGKESAPAKNNPFSPDKADVVSKPSTRRSRRNQLQQSEPKSEVPQKSTRSGRKSSRSKKSKQVEEVPMYEEEPIEDDSQIVMPMIEEDDEEVEEPEQLPSQRQQLSSEKQFADQIAEEQDEQFGLQVVEQEHVSQVQLGSQQVEEEEEMVPNPDILDVGFQQEDVEDVEQQEEENASVEQQQESIEQVDDETVEEASPAVEDDAQPSNDTEMVEQPSVQEEQIASATEDENDEEIHESQQNVLGLVQEDVPQPVEDSEEMEDVAPEQNSDDEEEEPESPEEQQNNQVLQQDFQEYEEQSNGEQQYVAEEEQVVEDQEEESENEQIVHQNIQQVEQIASEKESDDDEEDEYVSAREDQDDEEQNEQIQVQEVENEEEQGEEEAEEAEEVVQQEWQEQADEELVSDEEQQVLEDPIIDFYNNFDDDEEEEGEYIPNSSSDTPNAHTIEDGESEEFQIQEQLSNQESQQQAFFDPVTRISPSASNKKSAKKEKTPSRQSPQKNVNQFSTPQQMPKQKSSQHHSSVPKIMQPHQDLAQIINQKNTDTKGKKNKGKKQQPEKKENDEKEFEKTITNSATKLSKDKRKRVQQLEESINYLQTILDQEQSDQMLPPQQAQHGRKSTKPFMDDIIDSFPDFTHVIPSAQKNKGQQMMQKNMLKQMRGGARPKKVDTFDIEESTMNQFGHVFENEIEMGSFQNQQVQPKKNQSVGKLGGRGRPPKNKSVEKSPAKPSKQKHMSLGFELNDNSQVEQSNQQLKKRGRPTKQEQTIQKQESEIIGFAAGVEDEVLPTEEDFKKKGGKKNKNVKPFKDFVPETIGFKAGNNPFLAKKSKGLRTLIATPSKFADRKQSSQGKKKTVDKKLKSKGIKKTEIMKLLKDKTRKEKQKLRDKRNREQVQKQQLKLKKKEKKLQMLQKLAMKRQKVKEAKQFMVEKQKENAKLQREKLKILKAKKEQREADKKAKSEVQAKIKATVEKEIELRKQKLQEEKNKIRAEEKRAQEMAERKAMKARSSYNVPVSTRREQKQLHKDAVKKQSKKTFSQSPPPKKIPTPSVQNKSNNSASKSVKNSATKSAQNSKTKSLSNLKVSKSLRTSKTVVVEKKELRGTRSHAQAKTPPKQPKEMIKKAVTTKEKVPAKIQEAVKQKSTLKSNKSSPGNAKPKVVEKVKISKTNSAMSDVKSARSKASQAQSLLGKKRPHAEMMKKSVTSNKKGQEKSKQTFKQPLMRTRKSVRK